MCNVIKKNVSDRRVRRSVEGQWWFPKTKLAAGLKGLATIIDQSDGKAVLRISGLRARDTLAKGCSLDLHPSAFKPGSVGTTPVALIDCVIWQVDETPTYDLAIPTSFAESFWSWLTASAAEYGYTAE